MLADPALTDVTARVAALRTAHFRAHWAELVAYCRYLLGEGGESVDQVRAFLLTGATVIYAPAAAAAGGRCSWCSTRSWASRRPSWRRPPGRPMQRRSSSWRWSEPSSGVRARASVVDTDLLRSRSVPPQNRANNRDVTQVDRVKRSVTGKPPPRPEITV